MNLCSNQYSVVQFSCIVLELLSDVKTLEHIR